MVIGLSIPIFIPLWWSPHCSLMVEKVKHRHHVQLVSVVDVS